MKYIKVYETFNENKIKIGDILKRKSIDDKHWNLSIVTNVTDFSRDIQIYYFAITSLDFERTKFITSQSPHNLNRWFINEYSLLDNNEIDSLCTDINNTEEYYFRKIEELTNINLKKYAINKNANKYNL